MNDLTSEVAGDEPGATTNGNAEKPPTAPPPSVPLVKKKVATTQRVTFDPATPTTPGGPSPSLVQQENNRKFLREKEQLDDIVNGLEFGENQHTLNVRRIEPSHFKGQRVGGYVTDIKGRPSIEDIKQRYGGGKFRFTVMGPGPNGTRRIVTSMDIEIAGDPIPEDNGTRSAQSSGGLPPEVAGIVQSAMEKSDRATERLEGEVRESRKELFQALTSKGDGGVTNMITLMQQQAAEDRRLQREQMQADKEDRRREAEAAERRAREDREAAERRHQQTLETTRQQYQMQIEAAKVEADRREREAQRQFDLLREQQKQDAEEKKRLYELELKKAERSEKDRAEESRRNMEFMTQQMTSGHAAQMTQLQALDNMKTQFFKEMVENGKKQRSPWQELIEAKQVFDTLSGNDDERDTWERVLDRVEQIGDKVAPSLLAAAGIGLGARGAAKALAAKNPQPGDEQPQRRRLRRGRVQPGSAAVVDIEPPTQEKPVEAVQEAAAPAADEVPDNDLTVLTFPKEGASIDETFILLVKDVDYALARDFSPPALVESILLKFPPMVQLGIRNMSADEVIALLEERAPPTWRINSPDGHKKMREAHALMLSTAAPAAPPAAPEG